MKKTFYMMRHGQTLFNVRRKIQGACDSPLTELGKQQALKAREHLVSIDFDHYYSSTSERSSDTLELIIGETCPYTRLKGLKERDFGTFEGESEDLNPRFENGYDVVFPHFNGETSEEVRERTRKVALEIMSKEDHQCVLALSHSGACFHFLRNWADEETITNELSKGFSNCCILKYEYEDGVFKFIEMIRV